jgi:hypothetical protein
MASKARMSLFKNAPVVTLGDDHGSGHPEMRNMAFALFRVGVPSDVNYEWRAGLRMITAGQQVSLTAEMTRLEREKPKLMIAA